MMAPAVGPRVKAVLADLARRGTAKDRAGLARYGIVAKKAFGISVGALQKLGKSLGRDHALALALWQSGWYEARLLAAFVDEVDAVTPAQMDAWARDFENWGDCDTVVMHLFDRTPHAWPMARKWCGAKDEFVKRAGFAMLASMALHHKDAPSAPFIKALALVKKGAIDERNFVKKAVNWALRSIGSRDTACHAAALRLAAELADRDEASSRWVGKDALRQLSRPATMKRVARGSR
jgi:3-methyladenine DNA glycosylase AlkD